jgi:hypothetical protein
MYNKALFINIKSYFAICSISKYNVHVKLQFMNVFWIGFLMDSDYEVYSHGAKPSLCNEVQSDTSLHCPTLVPAASLNNWKWYSWEDLT